MLLRYQIIALRAAPLACLLLVSCGTHAEKTVERSASPLIATWNRDGDTSAANGSGRPQFTTLTFASDGSLKAKYAAGGVGAAIGSSPSVKSENDTYTTAGTSHLSIAEGTRHLDYRYTVSGSRLYLTPAGGHAAAVFTKAA